MSIPLQDDGWPEPAHVECFNEVEYLRQRVDAAERVILAARRSTARGATKMDEVGLVYAVNDYGSFLGRRPDRWAP